MASTVWEWSSNSPEDSPPFTFPRAVLKGFFAGRLFQKKYLAHRSLATFWSSTCSCPDSPPGRRGCCLLTGSGWTSHSEGFRIEAVRILRYEIVKGLRAVFPAAHFCTDVEWVQDRSVSSAGCESWPQCLYVYQLFRSSLKLNSIKTKMPKNFL